jgi:N-acetylmuramoyl-L-alanine amidase
MGKTIGILPFLEYGPGDDRLGGAKMTYLDTGVYLRITDSLGGDYVVWLSESLHAFIPRENIVWADTPVTNGYALSGAWKIFGDESFDYLSISLPAKIPYRSMMTTDPARIVVDLYGLTSNTNWINHLSSATEIREAWYEQVRDGVLRVHIALRHNRHWGHQVYYDTTTTRLVVRVRRQPDRLLLRNLRIAIDAGHGGTNTGASGVQSGIPEKKLTLLIARELENQLRKKGVKNLFMTRRTDTTLGMPERVMMLREFNPDVLISIHLNSSSSDTVRGTSTYYRHIAFRPLSVSVLHNMLELGLPEFGNIGSFNFALNGPVDYPNCLVEVAFLSNREDEKKITDPRFQAAVAKKIVEGIRDWIDQMK